MTACDPHDAAERARVAALLRGAAATEHNQMVLLGELQAAAYPEAARDWGRWTWGDVLGRLAELIEPTDREDE